MLLFILNVVGWVINGRSLPPGIGLVRRVCLTLEVSYFFDLGWRQQESVLIENHLHSRRQLFIVRDIKWITVGPGL